MISETSVSNPYEERRGLPRERQVSMDSGRGQIALPRLDQRMLEDMDEPHMPTIHENARVDPLTVDDPWSRVRTSNQAACMSMDDDLSRSRTRQFHEGERRGYGSGCPVPMSTNTYDIYTPRDDAIMPQACMAHPTPQNESEPQMWYPPSTHHQAPEPRPMMHEVGVHMPHALHDPRIPSGPIVKQGTPDPFDFQNQVGGQGGGNHVHLANNKTNHPREASSIELPKLPTPPKFRVGVQQYVGLLRLLPLVHNPGCKAERCCLEDCTRGTLLTGRQALAIVSFLHGWEDLNDLRCRSDSELSQFWTTWQYLMLSMGEKVPEHLLLELLWTNVKDLRSLSDEWLYFKRVRDLPCEHWLYFKRVRDLPYEHPDYSLKYIARCIEHGVDIEVSTVPNEVGDIEHDPTNLLDDDLYAVPRFTGRSPREKPQKPSTSARESQGTKPNGAKKDTCKLWASTGTCRCGDKCKYSHDAPALVT
eukprot:4790646-Amphidinium_carterae.2